MPTLFDQLSKTLNSDQDPTAVTAPQQDQILQGLRAKTGKATATTTPGASNLAEQSAITTAQNNQQEGVQQARAAGTAIQTQAGAQAQQASDAEQNNMLNTRLGLQQVATQAQATGEQTAATAAQAQSQTQFGEDEKIQQLNAKAYQTLQQLASDKSTTVDNIWRDYSQSQQDLAYRKDAAQIEQTGFVLALRDKSYVDNLNRIGQERQLNDSINYQDEMHRVVLGDQLDATVQQIGFKEALGADQRNWDTKLAQMDIDSAIQISQASIAAGSQNMMVSGAGQVAAGAIDYGLKNYKSSGSSDQFDDNGEGQSDAILSNGELKNGSGGENVNVDSSDAGVTG